MARSYGYRRLPLLDTGTPHKFEEPKKCINQGGTDLPFFLTSLGYTHITTFLIQLNLSLFPQIGPDSASQATAFPLDSPIVVCSPAVQSLQRLLQKLTALIDDFPPDSGPRRFGNISFRRWYEKVIDSTGDFLSEHVPQAALAFPSVDAAVTAREEVSAYFIGSFGSAQRLDYGTGHELSFLAFLACLWRLGAFDSEAAAGVEERAIVIKVVEEYFVLIRKLIITYNLEPAGSHGVWGLDDHSFLPYIFGSAQLSPPIPALSNQFQLESIPTEGSLSSAPRTGDIMQKDVVEEQRKTNMYFRAIGFIHDVKKGPFWEHSPVLYDISGITAGWAKINKGMLKMYNAEVLSKFPVVQHFPFGSLFQWATDPNASPLLPTTHSANQAAFRTNMNALSLSAPAPVRRTNHSHRAFSSGNDAGRAGRSDSTTALESQASQARRLLVQPQIQESRVPQPSMRPPPLEGVRPGQTTTAPWAKADTRKTERDTPAMPSTRAPWAEK